MDAVELGRQSAARLHEELVHLGYDPWKPLVLVASEAERRGIEINAITPGSPLLAGARAIFDPLSRSIRHEKTGSDFDDAFLIAHELGHVVLGDDSSANATTFVDPERPAEAAPIGEERVVDYSRKARREVQMDLFARELLLPRSFVRRLHIDESMSASDVAKRLGAPLGVVAQQLLDALLLPPAPEPNLPGPERPLNEQQLKAAEHGSAPFLLEAGPGTGKTKTLEGRIDYLVRRGADPRSVVVLTYSNKAANELSTRIAALNADAASAMWVGTFHAFGLNLIRRFHKEMGYETEPGLLERADAVNRLLTKVASLDLKYHRDLYDPTMKLIDVLSATSRAKDEVVSPERYEALARAMRAKASAPAEFDAADSALEVARVYRCYEELKRSLGRVDFGDLISGPVAFLETHEAVRLALRKEYRHILVDEYQDVNRASVRLLQQLTENGRNLWCVGDARQSIYRFRGASSYNMARFATEDFPDARVMRLQVNYRSRDEIVRAFSSFSASMPVSGVGTFQLEAHRGQSGKAVEFRSISGHNESEMDALAQSIEELRKEGHAYRDQALLCSGNDRLAKLGVGLERRGIPVLYLGSLFERPEIKDLLSWLSLLVDRRAMALARVGSFTDVGLTLSDLHAILSGLRHEGVTPLVWCTKKELGTNISPEGMKALSRYAQLVDGFDSDSNPWEALALLLLERTRIAASIATAGDVATRTQGIAIWQFMNFVRAHSGGGYAAKRLLDRIRLLVLLSDERDLRQLPGAAQRIDAVRLMTMHGSKGLQFPVVHIPGMNQGTLPRGAQPSPCPPPDGMVEGTPARGQDILKQEHHEEQECLFYVALSRAEDRLVLYAPTQTVTGTSRRTSEFIDRLGTGIRRSTAANNHSGMEDPQLPHITWRSQGDPSFTLDQLALYERCPRRFFYTHLLEIGGRAVSTEFTEMHRVVREVVQVLAANPQHPVDDVSIAELTERRWQASNLADTPLETGYRRVAGALISNFVSSRRGRPPSPSEDLHFKVAGVTVVVRADDVLVEADGSKVYRLVRTGHRTTTFMQGKAVSAFWLAIAKSAPRCRAEMVFLSDGTVELLELKPHIAVRRESELAGYVDEILRGYFTPLPSARTCPKCPAFFICGPVPAGCLEKKFS